MSELVNPHVQNKSSAPLVWILGLLSALLLGIATAAAVRHNPLYSDRDAYGISKYRLIEHCKEGLHDTANLSLNLGGQSLPLNQLITQWRTPQANGQALLHNGEEVIVKTTATSAQLVSGVQEATAGNLGLISPVLIAARQGDAERPIGQANMQCMYDKATGKTNVQLSVGGSAGTQ